MLSFADMKRSRLLIPVLVVVAILGYAVHRVFAKRAQQRREADYQQKLNSYAEVLKPGMSRRDVEGYLRSKGRSVRYMCCINHRKADTWDELVKIGEEDAGWFCSKLNIYVGFQFTPHEQTADSFDTSGNELDTLARIQIFRQLEGCL